MSYFHVFSFSSSLLLFFLPKDSQSLPKASQSLPQRLPKVSPDLRTDPQSLPDPPNSQNPQKLPAIEYHTQGVFCCTLIGPNMSFFGCVRLFAPIRVPQKTPKGPPRVRRPISSRHTTCSVVIKKLAKNANIADTDMARIYTFSRK